MDVSQPNEKLSLTSLFPQELDLYQWRAGDGSEDESSEWEEDNEPTNGEVSHDDGNTFNVFNL